MPKHRRYYREISRPEVPHNAALLSTLWHHVDLKHSVLSRFLCIYFSWPNTKTFEGWLWFKHSATMCAQSNLPHSQGLILVLMHTHLACGTVLGWAWCADPRVLVSPGLAAVGTQIALWAEDWGQQALLLAGQLCLLATCVHYIYQWDGSPLLLFEHLTVSKTLARLQKPKGTERYSAFEFPQRKLDKSLLFIIVEHFPTLRLTWIQTQQH